MSDLDGGAAAPADGGSLSNVDTSAVQTQTPISTEPRPAPETKPEPKQEPEGRRSQFRPVTRGDAEDGLAHVAYCLAAGRFAADKSPMTLDALIHAFHNPGGKFLRKMKEEA